MELIPIWDGNLNQNNMYTGPNIITDGLVSYIDVMNTKCYTSGSTTYRNLGTDTGSVTLSANNQFTGISLFSTASVTQVAWTPAYPTFNTQQGTFSLWIKMPNGTTTSTTSLFYAGGTSNNLIQMYRLPNTPPTNAYYWLIYHTGSLGEGFYLPVIRYEVNNWCNTVLTFTNDGTGSVYVNGVLRDTQNVSGFTAWRRNSANTPNINMFVTASGGVSQYGEFGAFQFYNRALSAAEIAQNYNSQKSRFNL